MSIDTLARAVVTCENNQRIIADVQMVQSFYYLSEAPVGQDDLVAAGTCLAFALDEIGRQLGDMRHRKW